MKIHLAATLVMLASGSGAFAASLTDLPASMDTADLATINGGAAPSGLAVTTQDLSASNSNNSVSAGNSVITGDINTPQGAFSGFSGVGNFVFNTGNNNNVQSTLSVTIMAPVN